MKKLVKVLLGNVKKEIGILLLVPFLMSLATLLASYLNNDTVFGVFFGFSLFISFIVYGAILLIALSKDYKTFFTEGASFFSALPIKPLQVVNSRYLYYFIIGLVSLVINSFSQFIMIYSAVISSGKNQEFRESFTYIFENIGVFFSQIPLSYIFLLIFLFFLSIFSGIGQLVFSISFGSEKKLRKFGMGGPILAYIGLTIITSIISTIIGFLEPFSIGLSRTSPSGFSTKIIDSSAFRLVFEADKMNIGNVNMGLPMFGILSLVFSLLLVIFLYWRTYTSHKDKLSVY